MVDAFTEEAQFNLPAGTGDNPQEDYNENFEIADQGSGWVTAEIAVGHGGVEGEWYTFDSTGKAIKADASDNDKCKIVFMLTEDTAEGVEGKFIKLGWWEKTAWALDTSKFYYLSQATPGAMVTTKPATGNIIRLGKPKSTEKLHIQVTSEIEVASDGGGICDVTVGPDPEDDYTLLSAACAGEKDGTVIGIKPGNYAETADVTVKDKQTVMAYGGVSENSGGGPSEDPGVLINMGDYQLKVPYTGFKIVGVYFNFTPTTNELKVDMDGSDGLLRDVTFDFTDGTSNCIGVETTGASNIFENVKVYASGYVTSPFKNTGANCTFRDVLIGGGNTNASDVIYDSGANCIWDRVFVTSPNGTGSAYYLFNNVGNYSMHFGMRLYWGDQANNGLRLAGSSSKVFGLDVDGGAGSYGLNFAGSHCIVSGFRIANCATGSGTDGVGVKFSAGSYHKIADGTISNCGTGVQGSGASSFVQVRSISFVGIGGSWDIDNLDGDHRWNITGCRHDLDVRIGGDYCVFDQNDGTSTNLQVLATATGTILGNNPGIEGSTTDLGVATKWGATIHPAAVAPSATDDDSKGYKVGVTYWFDTVTLKLYKCDSSSSGAAVWTEIGGSAQKGVLLYSVATAAQMKSALDALQASDAVKGIVTITADISTDGSYDPTGALNKDVDFQCAVGDQHYWDIGNGFTLSFDQDGHMVRLLNLNLRTSGSSGPFIKCAGFSTGEPEVTLEVRIEGCKCDNLVGAQQVCQLEYYGRLKVSFDGSTWDNSGAGAGYLVGFNTNNAHTRRQTIELYITSSDLNGPIALRNSNAPCLFVDIKKSVLTDSAVKGVWNNVAAPGTPTAPDGTFTVFQDAVSSIVRNLVSGSAVVDFRVKENWYTEIVVDKTFPANFAGRIYTTVKAAVQYTQDNPTLGPYVIKIGPGEHAVSGSLIMNITPVVFRGSGKDKTTLIFDRTGEGASNYFIRSSTSASPSYASRICMAFCDYTDYTTYGHQKAATWSGRWGVYDMTLQVRYAGDRTTYAYMTHIHAKCNKNGCSDYEIDNVRFDTKGAPIVPLQGVGSDPDSHFCVYVYAEDVTPVAGDHELTSNTQRVTNCSFRGYRQMTGLISTVSGTTALTGSGTKFTEELHTGGVVWINGDLYTITAVISDTSATLGANATNTNTGVMAVAINQLCEGLYINFNHTEPSATGFATYRNLDFSWLRDRVIYHYGSELLKMDAINLTQCAFHNQGHSAGIDTSAIVVNSCSVAMLDGIKFQFQDHLEDIVPGTNYYSGIGVAQYNTHVMISHVDATSPSNVFGYYHGVWARAKVTITDFATFQYGWARQREIYLDGSISAAAASSVIQRYYMANAASNESLYIDTGVDNVKVTDCRFDEDVYCLGDNCVFEQIQMITGTIFQIEGDACSIDRVYGDAFRVSYAVAIYGLELSGCRFTTANIGNGTYNPDGVVVNGGTYGSLVVAANVTTFRIGDATVTTTFTLPYQNDYQIDNCNLPATTINGDRTFVSNTRFTSTLIINGSDCHVSGGGVTGAATINGDNNFVASSRFNSTLLLSAGADQNRIEGCSHYGAITDSGSGNHIGSRTQGEMYINDDGTVTAIDKVNSWHGMDTIVNSSHLIGMNHLAGTIAAVTGAFANGGGGLVTVTAAGHGLSNGQPVTIVGTTNYDGAYIVLNAGANTFDITATYVAEGAAGNVIRPATLRVGPTEYCGKGKYHVTAPISMAISTANKDFEYAIFKNATLELGSKIKRRFSSTDVGAMALAALMDLAEGDYIWIGMRNVTDATDGNVVNIAVTVHKT